MVDLIKQSITMAIPNSIVHVMNPRGDQEHFEAVVISDSFEGMPIIKQHRAVMEALKNELSESVHALQLKTYTPAQWSAQEGNT